MNHDQLSDCTFALFYAMASQVACARHVCHLSKSISEYRIQQFTIIHILQDPMLRLTASEGRVDETVYYSCCSVQHCGTQGTKDCIPSQLLVVIMRYKRGFQNVCQCKEAEGDADVQKRCH